MKKLLLKNISVYLGIVLLWNCSDPNEIIMGCTKPSACNFDQFATDDDGTCKTNYLELPMTSTIISGDSCLADKDIQALNDLIQMNALEEESALHLGYQTWKDSRLRVLVANMNAGQYPAAIQTPIDTLPESFGNLDDIRSLYLEWNNIRHLPQSFNQLVNLQSLVINNNKLETLIDDIDSLSLLSTLDLGYNNLYVLPQSIINLTNLSYLYLFNNSLVSLPEGFCDLNLEWNENDNNWLPYFAIGGNQLCENVPSCIMNSENFEISLEPFYYSFAIEEPQDCD